MKKFWVIFGVLPIMSMLVLLLVGFGATTAAAPGQSLDGGEYVFTIPDDAPDPNETLRLVNQERQLAGLPALAADEKLGAVAKARAHDMAKRQYYAHKNPDGKYYFDLFDKYGIDAGYNCENLDLVFVPSQDVVIDQWMASLKGHRGCMMHPHVQSAGYATTRLTLVDYQGNETTAYLVVAIHASL